MAQLNSPADKNSTAYVAPPAAPTGVSASSGNTQATISWTAVSGATGYNLYYSTTSGVTSSTGTKVTGVSSPYVLKGLANGTSYYLVVTAVNTGGESPSSIQQTATPQLSATAAPTGLTATASSGQVSLAWSTVSGSTGYNVYRSGSTGSQGTKLNPTPISNNSYVDTGLINGTTYFYEVTSVNAGGESSASTQQSATPQVSAAGAPLGFSATASSGQVSLAWSTVSGSTGYNVYRSGSMGSQGTKLNSAPISNNSYVDTGVTNGTTYYYEVTAVNAGGESSASTQQSATPQVATPGQPTGLSATAGGGQVSLTWSTVSTASGYNVYRSNTSGSQGAKLNSALVTSNNYVDSGLTNGTKYYYEVTAVNAGGESLASTQQSATPGSNWVQVGIAGFSAGAAYWPSVAVSSTGTPYVAFEDFANAGEVCVMKFSGTNWVQVGSDFSSGAQTTSIALDSSDTPYVAFSDSGSSQKASVMKFNGASWVQVGAAGFSTGVASYTCLAIDSSGTPYVGYEDQANSSKASVMKFNGTSWVQVGAADFTAGAAVYPSIAIDKATGTPYFAYGDGANGTRASVMKFNGTSWVQVGTVGFTASTAYYSSIAVNASGTPYLGYADLGYNGRASVMKFSGSSWVQVGSPGFSAGGSGYESIALDSSGVPYLSFEDDGYASKATVMKFNGTSWVLVGTGGFSAAAPASTSLAISSATGSLFVCYEDGANGPVSVMKY